ncbi:hypothetical protein Q5692_12075 [Microcoleus sp. C2C3]
MFIRYRFFISGRMNPGACILDAFGQRADAVIERFVVDRPILEI